MAYSLDDRAMVHDSDGSRLAKLDAIALVDAAALVDILGADLSQRAPGHAETPLGGFLHQAVGILPASAGGDAERRPGGAGGSVRHRGILPDVADELHAIQVVHGGS